MKVFLAYSFRDQDRDLVADLEALFESHDVRMVTGEQLGGEALTPAVKERIRESHGLVALLTRRDEKAGGGWTTHDWVRDELNFARDNHIPAIAYVETKVDVGGMYGEQERIPYDRGNPLAAFVALSSTLGQWKRKRGRTVQVQILPNDLAHKLGYGDDVVKCRYRLFVNGAYTPWEDAEAVVPMDNATYVWVNGVPDECMIQMRVEEAAAKWISPAKPQWMQVELKKLGVDQ